MLNVATIAMIISNLPWVVKESSLAEFGDAFRRPRVIEAWSFLHKHKELFKLDTGLHEEFDFLVEQCMSQLRGKYLPVMLND